MSDDDEIVEIEHAHLMASSEIAGLYLIEGEKYWIPWSKLDTGSIDKDGQVGSIYIPEWLADEKGIPY